MSTVTELTEGITLRIRVGEDEWKRVERYLYGAPYVRWDTRRECPATVDDPELGLSYEVYWSADEARWGQGTLDRLASGMIAARKV